MKCMGNALGNYSDEVHEFLDVCHTETKYVESVKEADWITNMV